MASKADKRSRPLLGNAAVENYVAIAHGGNWPFASILECPLFRCFWRLSGRAAWVLCATPYSEGCSRPAGGSQINANFELCCFFRKNLNAALARHMARQLRIPADTIAQAHKIATKAPEAGRPVARFSYAIRHNTCRLPATLRTILRRRPGCLRRFGPARRPCRLR